MRGWLHGNQTHHTPPLASPTRPEEWLASHTPSPFVGRNAQVVSINKGIHMITRPAATSPDDGLDIFRGLLAGVVLALTFWAVVLRVVL